MFRTGLLFLLPLLAACALPPDLGPPPGDGGSAWPALVPQEDITAAAAGLTVAPETAAGLQARAAALKARAAGLRAAGSGG